MHQTAMTKAVAGREPLRHDRTYTPHTKGKEAMSAYTLDYTYTSPSALIDGADSRALSLATSGGSTPEGAASHPYFFSGFLERADVYATALLVVARVARTRFYVPPSSSPQPYAPQTPSSPAPPKAYASNPSAPAAECTRASMLTPAHSTPATAP